MKAIVTGGTGFIGSNLALALQDKGVQVTVIDHHAASETQNLSAFKGEVMVKDINDVTWDKLGKVDVVFHQGACTDTRVIDEKQMMKANVTGFQKVIEYCLKHEVRLVYASSAAVYGGGRSPQSETGPLVPLNVYGKSKLIGDQMAGEVAEMGEIVIIGLRYFNVFGMGEQPKGSYASMIYQLAEQMRSGKRPRIFRDGNQSRDHIYVKDVVDANLKALEATKSGVVNCGTGISTTFNRLIEILNDVLGTDLAPDYFANPYNFYQNQTRATTEAAFKLLGFKSKWTVENGVRDYFSLLYGIHASSR